MIKKSLALYFDLVTSQPPCCLAIMLTEVQIFLKSETSKPDADG